LADRDRRVSTFPQKFSWIHQFDALQTAQDSMQRGGPSRAKEQV